MIIRAIELADAEQFASLLQQVDARSTYMLWEVGERKTGIGPQRKMIEAITEKQNSIIFVAEREDHELVGYLLANGGNAKRNQHAAYLVIGLLEEVRGQGVGTKLFEAIEKWAKKQQLHRLELTVVTKNIAGIALYKKVGFEIEGIKRDTLLIDGEFMDEYQMAKIVI